jgi:hypothetical protein
MSLTITINSVPTGKEEAVAREVKQDPIRDMIEQIKATRAYEARLGYV